MPEHSAIRPAGTLIITTEAGAVIERDTHKCCHCQGVFVVVRGSGNRRGFCTKCMGPTCGNPACDACKPWEKQLEEIEKAARA